MPESGSSAPVMILISVDLPAPFSPTNAWTSPGAKSNERHWTMRCDASYLYSNPSPNLKGGRGSGSKLQPRLGGQGVASRLLLLVCFWLGSAPGLFAHDPGLSTATIQLNPNKLEVVIVL